MKQTTIPTLHHLSSSISMTILVALEEISSRHPDFRYNLKLYSRISCQAPPELKELHPLGKSPILVLDAAPGHTGESETLTESRLILRYLADTYSHGAWKPSTDDIKHDVFFTEFVRSTLLAKIDLAISFTIIPDALPFGVSHFVRLCFGVVLRVFMADLQICYQLIEDQLSDEKPWVSGARFGQADMNALFPLDLAVQKNYGWVAERWPKLAAWHERMKARESYQRALEIGGLYDLVKFA